ncbi:MAG: diacylglycerol/lipid kinase family protein [Solirubrobacteraceae bacterium]
MTLAGEPLDRLAETVALSTPTERRRMLIIVNPFASTVSPRLRNLVVSSLAGRYEVEAVDTQSPNHATDLVREAAHEGYDVVVSFGGDGTVNEVANGLAGSQTPMSCLPGGATNVLCKMLGIPGDIIDATEHLLHVADNWRPRRIDLGTANGRAFTYSSGFGLDASVAKRIDRNLKLKASRGRELYFVYCAVETVLREYVFRAPRMDVHIGGEAVRAITTLVQNGDPFTYLDDTPIRVAEGATLDGGTLAGVALRGARPWDVPAIMLRLLSARRSVVGHRQIHHFADVRELRCTSADGRAIPLHVDGDHVGDVTEAVFGIRPAALLVVA